MFRPSKKFANTQLDYLYSAEKAYIKELERDGLLLSIENVLIDVPNIISRRFSCNPSYCVRRRGNKYFGSCCTGSDIEISGREVRRVSNLFRTINGLYNIPDTFWGVNFIGEFYLLRNVDNTCVLSYWDKEKGLRCLIHRMCEEQNLDVSEYKPHVCYMWPLVVTEHEAGKYFLTSCASETCEIIGSDRRTGNLRCLRSPRPSWPFLYQALEKLISEILGKRFFDALREKAHGLGK